MIKRKILRATFITLLASTPYTGAYYSYRSGVTIAGSHTFPSPLVKNVAGMALGLVGIYGLFSLAKKSPIKRHINNTTKKITERYKDFNKNNPTFSTGITAILSVGALVGAYRLLNNK